MPDDPRARGERVPDRADPPPIDLSKSGAGSAARAPDEPTPLLPAPPPAHWSGPVNQQPDPPRPDASRPAPPSVTDHWWPHQQTDMTPKRRSVPVTPILIGVFALLIAGTAVIAFGFHSGHPTAASGTGSTSPFGPSSIGSSSTSAPPSPTPASPSSPSPLSASSTAPSEAQSSSAPERQSSTFAPPTGATQKYSGNGGLVVTGPRGWHRDYSAKIGHIADYSSPGTTTARAGDFFRIGVGNPTPTGSFRTEADQAAQSLRENYDADILAGPSYHSYLGTTAADIEYQYVSSQYGVRRHGIERVWRHGGQTMIIESSGLSEDWQQTITVFKRLLSSAREQ